MAKLDFAKTIESVKTPLGFFALVILVSEGLLMYLIRDAKGTNLTILTVGCVGLPFVCMALVFLLNRKGPQVATELAVKPEIKPPTGRAYDLFVSAPMAAFPTEQEFKANRSAVLDVVRGMKKYCKFKAVFYAGDEIEKISDFESEDASVVEDYDACARSTYFVLIYPQKLATSALIELGWAMAHKKPIILFTKQRADLPFLAKNADAVFSNLRIYEYKTSADIINRFHASGAEIFVQLTKPPQVGR